jgi:hypothetical protein
MPETSEEADIVNNSSTKEKVKPMASPTPPQDPAIQNAVSSAVSGGKSIVGDIQSGDTASAVGDIEHTYEHLAPLVPAVIQETKAGYKTTEFWLLIAYEILQQTEALVTLHGGWQKAAATVTPLLAYILSRGIAKKGVPNEVPVI